MGQPPQIIAGVLIVKKSTQLVQYECWNWSLNSEITPDRERDLGPVN